MSDDGKHDPKVTPISDIKRELAHVCAVADAELALANLLQEAQVDDDAVAVERDDLPGSE